MPEFLLFRGVETAATFAVQLSKSVNTVNDCRHRHEDRDCHFPVRIDIPVLAAPSGIPTPAHATTAIKDTSITAATRTILPQPTRLRERAITLTRISH